ncbi:hypothetical protein SAMN04488505_104227 [Chitinophaga rupis]|uniref:Uncharacterized protein n=1 Tax=Chitinophaga rupis TaxID=573321 RepID=A0A1H7XXB8_9BACT|nr:hypothetical protein [Chitinophaga rupis]SEM38244.1 hypothetical protein SAMN04488505_104227 [Chitinophaga rupis]
MTNIEYLQDFIGTAIKSLEGVQAKGANEYSFDINCSDLEDFNFIDIRQAEKFKKIFDRLKERMALHYTGLKSYQILKVYG